MRPGRPTVALALAVTVLALTLSGCGGSDDETTPRTPNTQEAPGAGATPDPAGLPGAFVDCMAEQGYEVTSPSDIHSLPQQAFQACLGSLHGG